MTGRKNYVIPVLIFIVCMAGLLCSCSGGKGEQSNKNKIAKVTRGNLQVSVESSGHIEMPHQAKLAFEIGGTVENVYVELGDKVKKGQKLAKLDSSTLERAVERAKTNLEDAWQNLSKAGPDARSLEVARNKLKQAQIALADAREKLGKATLVAPFDGEIADVMIKEGSQVAPGTASFLLVDPSKVEVTCQMKENDVSRVERGQEATVTVDALPQVKLSGRIADISIAGKSKSGVITYKTKLKIENPPSTLRSGMTCTAHIVTQRKKDVLLVPTSAVRFKEGKSVVKVIGPEGEIETRKVEIGMQTAEQTEIRSGLKEGDKVLIESVERGQEGFGL